MKSELEYNTEINRIISSTKYFLKQIGDSEGNAYKEILIQKTDMKSKDMMSGSTNSLSKCIDTLNFIKERSTSCLANDADNAIELLELILSNIKLNDEKNFLHKSDFITHSHKLFKYTKRDILKLTYYALIEHYKNFERYKSDFKNEAISTIHYKFEVDLKNDALEVKIESAYSENGLYLSPAIPKKKLNYPTFGIRM